ncbi:helix-turn-helix domain-containing protein [Mucilaginibacter pallidiroseus]|uniref:Helix-turn-helix domain-containing protein n=1 Tax=Mucilaginibacter pallidiroseus TaxID=2599295 RepID=A0A563TZN6_9SPHI|nr:AraC family transcriptional regulator [Mucilaginibacter pallidiroseus]TWR24743.1 helix-turn-helix domain-containing protein [Mucilaginibacter pallidiroseus]
MPGTFRFHTLSDLHSYYGLPGPEHPMISLIDYSKVKYPDDTENLKWLQDFYMFALKRNVQAKFNYGQQPYDFDSGVLSFFAPQQLMHVQIKPNVEVNQTGWLLLVHPDLLWNTPLAAQIKNYQFFQYKVNEALFLSEKEEAVIAEIFQKIEKEYQSNMDRFSQSLIINQLEYLLIYADRFYNRQFLTRKITNHQILDKLEVLLQEHFAEDKLIEKGIPTVQQVADELNISANYLSTLLKVLTGQSTQQFIHDKLIEKAKEMLSSTELSVSQIAYSLGFEHSQSFSKLFKAKTALTPIEFRQAFN